MYTQNKMQTSKLQVNETKEGETLELKIRRLLNNKEPITDGSPLIYTERKDGVQAAYDIRTDRWEIAVAAMDAVTGSKLAKRDMMIGEQTYDTMTDDQKTKFHDKYPNSKIKQIQNEGGA